MDVPKRRIDMLRSSILICALLALTSACSKKTDKELFVYCSEGSPTAFNPQITTDGTSNNASAHTIYDRLVDFEYGTTKIVPSLATSWQVSSDRLTYTFILRRGVKFHQTEYFKPTRDFNADDVIFSFDRQRLKDHPYAKISGGNYDYFNSMEMQNLVESITKIDDYTLSMKLTKPEAPFIANMAMSFMSILSKEYADHLTSKGKQEEIDMLPVGTGPFVFESYKKDTIIRFHAHPEYFEAAPKIKKLVFAITPDANVRTQKLKAGECDLIAEPAPADIAGLRSNDNIKVLNGSGLNVGYLAMNVEKAPLDNVLVRQAINHALNKKSYIDDIYLGNAMVAKNPIPPTLWSYNDKIQDYDYNLEKAKALMAQSGVKTPLELDLWTLPVSRPYNPNGKKMGEIMQADLAKIGINVKLVTFDWPTYLSKTRTGEHTLLQMGWTGDNGDPDNFLHILLGCAAIEAGSNYARWCHKEFNDLIQEAKTGDNMNVRSALYEKAQEIFKREAPWATIAHSVIFRAMQKNIEGYKIDPLGGDIFKSVSKSE
jgi:dipeptide transport system substrate-binding protein